MIEYKTSKPNEFKFALNCTAALSSDAYSTFGSDHSEIHNEEVKQATGHLFDIVIPNMAALLDNIIDSGTDLSNSESLRESLSSSLFEKQLNLSGLSNRNFSVDTSFQINTPSSIRSSQSSIASIELTEALPEDGPPVAPLFNANSKPEEIHKASIKATQLISPQQLINIAHSHGINIRHLGLIRKHCNKPEAKNVTLLEMCARACRYL